jgi:carboxyl-terminal processing protease
MKDGRLIVLMNEWSASASEIFAGAMQDLDRGLIAGRRSYGKGLVGRNYTLPDGSAIRLTTGHYYTPSGRCIQKPYSDGIDDYRKDLQKRLDHGEYLHADSIHFPDSLKYQTKNGRTVYGGGGIMPDIFFPMDTTSFPGYYNKLFRKGIVNAFAGDYFDKNLGYLQRNFPDVKSFKNNFTISDKTISDLVAFAERQYNLTADTAAIGKTKDRIKIFLKAYIGRNLYENGAYYYLTNETDKVIVNSLEIISDKKAFKETKVKWK